ncbi:MAG TPA: hypothetical protein VGN47_16580 [Blastococcus sp.]|jgi:hypothetical protein|nr:hypothetical protein [Blastococcus sp.]
MSEREDSTPGTATGHPHGPEGGTPVQHGPSVGAVAPSATSYGTPGGGRPAYTAPEHTDTTAPQYSDRPVAVRRPDLLSALLLVLAGVAAAISLVLPWVRGSSATGLDLVRKGFSSFGHLAGTGLWQPLVIVLGGGVLFVLGLLVVVPARSHRFLGAVALVVTAFVAAGLLVPFADAHWRTRFFDLGFWFAGAVAVLGLLGGLKALLTGGWHRRR